MQPLYVDVCEDPVIPPQPIHLGFQAGVNVQHDYHKNLKTIGVNHTAINLRFTRANIVSTLKLIANELLLDF